MATIFITGASGFIGTWVIRDLLDRGHAPVAFDLALDTCRWELVLAADEIAAVRTIEGDVADREAVLRALDEAAATAIIHLAGLQIPTCRADPFAGARVNVIGTLCVLDAARELGIERVAYASSGAVFAPAQYDAAGNEIPVSEATVPLPRTAYGAFKVCNELCARAFTCDYGLTTIGLRPLTVYGPGRDVGLTSGPTVAILSALRGEKYTIGFSGRTAYTYAADVAAAFVLGVLEAPAGANVYTVGGEITDTPTFIAKLSAVVPEAAGLIDCEGGDLPVAAELDDSLLRKQLPAWRRRSLDEGIGESVRIFRESLGG